MSPKPPSGTDHRASRRKPVRLAGRHYALIGTVLAAPATAALVFGCGPFFPEPLLHDRKASLHDLPSFSFAYEVAHIFPAPAKPASHVMPKGDENAARGLYHTGAAAYRDATNPERGVEAFEAVLALPENSNAHEKVAAAFMLGKALSQRAYLPGGQTAQDLAEAARYFALTRRLVAEGWPDPDELGIASWGEEARLHLHDQQGPCGWREIEAHAACVGSIDAAEFSRALELYAHQAAAGSYGGQDSLRYLLGWASGRGDLIEGLAADPFSRRLLSLYILSFSDDYAFRETALKQFAVAVRRQGPLPDDQTAFLAAASYRQGQYDLAREFAARNPTWLAAWVRAKLAVQSGDIKGATQAYIEATKGFPTLAEQANPDIKARLRGEQGVLVLSRGEFIQAFAVLLAAVKDAGAPSDIAIDVSYIADRVLTVDELKLYVDQHIPARPLLPHPASDQAPPQSDVGDTVRNILIRRLVRDKRFNEALSYVPEGGEAGYEIDDEQGHPVKLTFRQLIARYAQSLSDGETRSSPIARASALFQAATIARRYGMEIMGSELAPDFYVFGGTFSYGIEISPLKRDQSGQQPQPGTARPAAGADSLVPYASFGERDRYDQSRVSPDETYHYRWVAVSYATKAADLLPPRSQAFAAVLCQAAGWQTDQTKALYERYVREGALVPFAVDFGRQCRVVPDFAHASLASPPSLWRRLEKQTVHLSRAAWRRVTHAF